MSELREDPRVVHDTGQPEPSSVAQQAHVQSGAIQRELAKKPGHIRPHPAPRISSPFVVRCS
jgi:hypothetical protein